MVVHIYSCLLTWIIPVQIHTGIITWNETGIFMNIQAYSCSWNFWKAGYGPSLSCAEFAMCLAQITELNCIILCNIALTTKAEWTLEVYKSSQLCMHTHPSCATYIKVSSSKDSPSYFILKCRYFLKKFIATCPSALLVCPPWLLTSVCSMT